MADLTVSYLGLKLRNPIIAGASYLTADMKTIKKMEDSGAGAIVIKSLFEEEIQLQRLKMDEDMSKFNGRYAEMLDFFPKLEHAGPEEHLRWITKTKETVSVPVIASLNAVEMGTWTDWALKIESAGADALELNLIDFPEDFKKTAGDIEENQISIIRAVRNIVKIPVSVKISSAYSNPLNFINRIDEAHVDGVVLFNRFFEPEINNENLENTFPFNLSNRGDYRRSLRFTGLLAGHIKADICGSCGIFEGNDVIKMILAGACCVQVVSTLYRNGVNHIGTMLTEMNQWMEKKSFARVDAFRGRLRKSNVADPWTYTRAQYVKLLMHPERIINNYPVL
jgi:dihydroorotate dehydrogenase (fumarate)